MAKCCISLFEYGYIKIIKPILFNGEVFYASIVEKISKETD